MFTLHKVTREEPVLLAFSLKKSNSGAPWVGFCSVLELVKSGVK